MLTHDRFNKRCYPLKLAEGFICLGSVFKMGEGLDKDLRHQGKGSGGISCGWNAMSAL